MIAAVEMPRRLRQRPKDRHGRPIPYLAPLLPDGTPDFRAADESRWLDCVYDRRCQLCGQVLDRAWFVGGPVCARNRQFLDPAMHRDCAEYALKVCPFLSRPRAHFSDPVRRPLPLGGVAVVPVGNLQRPERFMLGEARGWTVTGPVITVEGDWLHLVWWKDGAQVDG